MVRRVQKNVDASRAAFGHLLCAFDFNRASLEKMEFHGCNSRVREKRDRLQFANGHVAMASLYRFKFPAFLMNPFSERMCRAHKFWMTTSLGEILQDLKM